VGIAIPFLLYFGPLFTLAFGVSYRLKFPYVDTATLSFTTASNHFELAMAVAISVLGIASGDALSGDRHQSGLMPRADASRWTQLPAAYDKHRLDEDENASSLARYTLRQHDA
jgi:hypothetical protein